MRKLLPVLLLLFSVQSISAQQTRISEDKIDRYALNSIDLFRELLSIPNDAINHDDIEKNIQWSEDQFSQRGFALTRIETPTVPLLLAQKQAPAQKKPC